MAVKMTFREFVEKLNENVDKPEKQKDSVKTEGRKNKRTK